jgi:polyisoprenoid-binding protein YceI
MKKTIWFLLVMILLGMNILPAQQYRPVDNASSIKVTIRNFGMAIDGKLSGLNGEIRFNPADLKNSSFTVTIDANTINTGIDVRDSMLKTHEYLDAGNAGSISFLSKQITQPGKTGPYMMKGTLTIKGISKDIYFPFTAVIKNDGMLFTGNMRINRLDFKIATGSTVAKKVS